jgi:hypothetical protein
MGTAKMKAESTQPSKNSSERKPIINIISLIRTCDGHYQAGGEKREKLQRGSPLLFSFFGDHEKDERAGGE